ASTMDPRSFLSEDTITGGFGMVGLGDGTLGGTGLAHVGDADAIYDLDQIASNNPTQLGSDIDLFPRETQFQIGSLHYDDSGFTGSGLEVFAVTNIDLSGFWTADPNRLDNTPPSNPGVISDISDWAIGQWFFNNPGGIQFGALAPGGTVTLNDGVLTSIEVDLPTTFVIDASGSFGVIGNYDGMFSISGASISWNINETEDLGVFGMSTFVAAMTGVVHAASPARTIDLAGSNAVGALNVVGFDNEISEPDGPASNAHGDSSHGYPYFQYQYDPANPPLFNDFADEFTPSQSFWSILVTSHTVSNRSYYDDVLVAAGAVAYTNLTIDTQVLHPDPGAFDIGSISIPAGQLGGNGIEVVPPGEFTLTVNRDDYMYDALNAMSNYYYVSLDNYALSASNPVGTGLTFEDGRLIGMDFVADVEIRSGLIPTARWQGSLTFSSNTWAFDINQSRFVIGFGDLHLHMDRRGSLDLNPAPPDPDSDGDGLLDAWELLHFGDLITSDGSGDQDGDTFNDGSEFAAGTNPTNAASLLYIASIRPAGSNTYNLTWPGVAGKTYTLLHTTNLFTGPWTTNATGVNGVEPLTQNSSVMPGGRGYFRVLIQ
ncbi:MAG: hypothetical protein AAF492_10585, partial [Verrucomicrobiota bacterium]